VIYDTADDLLMAYTDFNFIHNGPNSLDIIRHWPTEPSKPRAVARLASRQAATEFDALLKPAS
jgi:hypothetical protein